MEKTFEYRIYPNACQRKQIAQTFGCCRFVYNRTLGIRKDAHDAGLKAPSINDCIKLIPSWKADPETAWLKDADSIALQQSLRDLDKAYRNFFRTPGKVGFPKFKTKRGRQSYRTQNIGGKAIQVLDGKLVKLPKLGTVKARISRPVEGRILSATVKQTASGKYFVCICCADCIEASLPPTENVVGIDLGSRKLVTTSDGVVFGNPKPYVKAEKKLAREQRRLSRKVGARKGEKASGNYRKQQRKVARIHEKVANQRRDYAHKLTTQLINENQVIAAERLRVKNMMRNRKLAKTVADASWGEMCRQLAYKADWYGRVFVQVDTWYPSSQICHVCGTQEPNTKDLRERWTCKSCGTRHDRDVNAAKNVLNEGLETLNGTAGHAGTAPQGENACGDTGKTTA